MMSRSNTAMIPSNFSRLPVAVVNTQFTARVNRQAHGMETVGGHKRCLLYRISQTRVREMGVGQNQATWVKEMLRQSAK